MVIGALIGLAISLLWTWIALVQLSNRVEKHNSIRLLVLTQGKATMRIHVIPIIIKAVLFTTIGAIIGHFVAG